MSAALADFLLARITEDETVARAASGDPWYVGKERGYPYAQPGDIYAIGSTPQTAGPSLIAHGHGCGPEITAEQSAQHIARHDPARVLAECAAKREIVEEHTPTQPRWPTAPGCLTCGTAQIWDGVARQSNCTTLRLLALPYADHPDYRKEWRL